ncbi:MAG: ABC transporter substrate-binding protein [Candidatus Bathyarchaeia archaeon]
MNALLGERGKRKSYIQTTARMNWFYPLHLRNTRAISKVVTGVIIVVILAAAAIAGIAVLRSSTPTQSVSSSTASTAAPSTLSIDDWNWPTSDLNVLYAGLILVWPFWLEYTVYQPLITVNATAEFQQGHFQYLPALAQNWTVSADDKVYTVNLRQGISFSNGDPFNAYQVWAQMYATYYLSGNSSAWLESYAFFEMSNVKFGPSTLSLLNESGFVNPSQQVLSMMENDSWPIYVTSPYQIVFRLQSPFAWFPGTLVSYAGLIYDVQYVLDHGGFGTPASINTYFNQHQIPGTGPYLVTGISENNYISFAQNPTYWGNNLSADAIAQNPLLDPGHVKNVVVNYRSDDVVRYTDLANGVAQISAISSSNWNSVLSNPDKYAYVVNPTWSPEVTAVALNTHLYPTNITDVRLAIVHAINYTNIAHEAFHDQVSPLVGPEYPAWDQFYNLIDAPPYQYNLTLAKQYLAEAHVTNMPTLIS